MFHTSLFAHRETRIAALALLCIAAAATGWGVLAALVRHLRPATSRYAQIIISSDTSADNCGERDVVVLPRRSAAPVVGRLLTIDPSGLLIRTAGSGKVSRTLWVPHAAVSAVAFCPGRFGSDTLHRLGALWHFAPQAVWFAIGRAADGDESANQRDLDGGGDVVSLHGGPRNGTHGIGQRAPRVRSSSRFSSVAIRFGDEDTSHYTPLVEVWRGSEVAGRFESVRGRLQHATPAYLDIDIDGTPLRFSHDAVAGVRLDSLSDRTMIGRPTPADPRKVAFGRPTAPFFHRRLGTDSAEVDRVNAILNAYWSEDRSPLLQLVVTGMPTALAPFFTMMDLSHVWVQIIAIVLFVGATLWLDFRVEHALGLGLARLGAVPWLFDTRQTAEALRRTGRFYLAISAVVLSAAVGVAALEITAPELHVTIPGAIIRLLFCAWAVRAGLRNGYGASTGARDDADRRVPTNSQ